ncbi:MAG: InlB B-repeat-containing protein [Clostridia bacterium]|nr:InlB B-repeat-containing protein [Clostridia bacterium]
MKQRILSVILAFTMIISVFVVMPMNQVSADTAFDNLTCSSFISNTTQREYIDMMMKYYLSANPDIVTALDNGKSAIFMFEGGSDNYAVGSYSASASNIRNQAVSIVIKKVNGTYSIVFYDENSSSIPSQPKATSGGASDGQTTLLDGIYKVKTWNHQSKYGALQIITNKGYYTPPSNPNGLVNTASGINIHTRTSSIAESGGDAWSWGCQLIGSGNNTSNTFNTFMKTVTGITYNVWNYWGSFKTITTGIDAGYYILDRQLGLKGLASLYNSTALSNITASSRAAYEKASATYINKCTYYPSYCDIKFTQSTKAYSYPCKTETNSESTVIATIPQGQEVTAYALYLNDKGEYWYRIITYGTTPAYVYAGDTEFLRERFDDVRVEGANAPQNIAIGDLFTIKGTAKSDYNKITGISAYALNGFDVNGSVATGGNDSISGNRYVLEDSNIDNKLLIDTLSAGNYTYIIFVNAENHHATSGSTKTSSVTAMVMKEAYFTVGGSTPVYTILLNANGGKGGVTSQPKVSGTALTLATDVPTREGYEFLGWSSLSDATSATYRAGDSFETDEDTTLYAVWQKSEGTESPEHSNIAFGKKYEISGNGIGYSTYTANLTDGSATSTLTYDNNWFAFYYNKDADASTVNAPDGIGSVVIDLGKYYSLSNVKINMINNVGAAILPPKAVKVYLSNDGTEFTEATDMSILQIENVAYWNESKIEGIARYVKVEFALNGSFVFLNEIEIYGEETDYTPEIMLGDVNDDKSVDSIDYLLVKRACFKTYELSENETLRADVNADGIIDSTDYLLVKRIAFGTYKA